MVIEPNATEIQALFERIAPVYDRLNDQLSFGLHRIWKWMALKWADPQPGECWLDLCCGSGDLALALAECLQGQVQIYGVDFAAEQLNVARTRAAQHAYAACIAWQQGDALNLDFPDQIFNGVLLGYGLRNVVDIPGCLRELQRVTQPGGRVVILDFHQPEAFWLRSLQAWYLQNYVVPTASQWNLTAEYDYLLPSLQRFPQGRQQVQLALAAGFQDAIHYRIAGGMMGVLVTQA
ncbi:MAG: bifunctional demethylmenaquinone methyltransferase/2-methoxy-6-polyprenyl-1,4-benzoquinol methylase UbiE [Cyanobacteria bacterium P01_H01_bin.121]